MIGNKLRLARQARGLSLQQLAELMQSRKFPMTKGTLSNYETGKILPQARTIEALAVALSVSPTFFEEPDWDDFNADVFNMPKDLSPSTKVNILSYIEMELSQYSKVCDLIPDQKSNIPYYKTQVRAIERDKIRGVCDEVRRIWNLGKGTIHSVCNMLEDENWVLLPSTDLAKTSSLSGIETSKGIRFVFYAPTPYADEFRMLLLKELGRAYLEFDADEEDQVLSFFAREMLFSSDIVRKQFGEKRVKILQDELLQAKQKYGISQRDIMTRLWELGIVSDDLYCNFTIYINQNGFIKRENRFSTLAHFQEEPQRFLMKRARASAEGLLDNDLGLVYR